MFILRFCFFMAFFLCCTTYAHAQKSFFSFGEKETIRFVQDTDIFTPEGKQLFLGHRIRTHMFLVPYSIKSQGLVLGVYNEKDNFLELNDAQRRVLQKAGLLPQNLPTPELRTIDYLYGYLLEILGFILLLGIGSIRVIKTNP